jgi:hypothetical protein
MKTAGPETSFKHASLCGEQMQSLLDYGSIESESLGRLAQREWPVRTRVTPNQFQDGLSYWFQ